MFVRNKKRKKIIELNPDEILLDVHNLPAFDTQQFEGRLERPISKRTLKIFGYAIVCFAIVFAARLVYLQVFRSTYYAERSELNSLDHIPLIADRGIIYDRNGVELTWNSASTDDGPTMRSYIPKVGFASLLGYVSYPTKDNKGVFWQSQTVGKDGIEEAFNALLSGKNGTQLIETDVKGSVLSKGIIDPPVQGGNLTLSIDAQIQETLAQGIRDLAQQSGYVGGAGAVMDINTGELLAMTSYPEYNQQILSTGTDRQAIEGYLRSSGRPFLNRVTQGLYTPGSIVKPFLSLGALNEGVITPNKILYTTGVLKVPNPYAPGTFTVFKDNADHGAVDMRKAIAVSSNIYFYEIGGGFGSQPGLGIANIEKYIRLFGIGSKTGINVGSEQEGTIPSIAWKQKRFPGDPWRIGDTYHTAIGQYGFQVTPIQMLRAVSVIASEGKFVTPTILKQEGANIAPGAQTFPFTRDQYQVVHDGMRMVVTEGTGSALNTDALLVAAKTGTAQIKGNTRVNSWVIGFLPYDHPKFAFVVLMEDGPKVSSGATHAFKPVVDLLVAHPELLTE